MPEDFFSSRHSLICSSALSWQLSSRFCFVSLPSFFFYPLLFGENHDNFSGESCEPTALVPKTTE